MRRIAHPPLPSKSQKNIKKKGGGGKQEKRTVLKVTPSRGNPWKTPKKFPETPD